MPKKIQITDDVRAVLEGSTITDVSVILPPVKLERDLYVRVDKVLKAAGGKWDRKIGAHLFTDYDPRELLSKEQLASGEIVNRQQALQQFFTRPETAKQIVEYACVEPGMRCLEPSAGTGNIARALRAALIDPRERVGRDPICVEIDEVLVRKLVEDGFDDTLCMDFLATDPAINPFDRIVMNPPFTGGQDVDHVTHAFSMLKWNGLLVAIMSPAFQFRSDKKHVAFRKLMDRHGEVVARLPRGSFDDTDIETLVVRLGLHGT